MALMYLPLNLDTMDWLMPAIFVVATVLQFWAGRGFYAAAWAAARHGATNMNTLVALGTAVAWGYSAFVTTRTVDSHVAELRRKIEADPANPRHVKTVWKVGYRFER